MEFKKDFSLKEYNSLELESSVKMFCDISNENELIEAVKLWCKNKGECLRKYGPISDWDVSNITCMKKLLSFINK